jgi:hypothetical protein
MPIKIAATKTCTIKIPHNDNADWSTARSDHIDGNISTGNSTILPAVLIPRCISARELLPARSAPNCIKMRGGRARRHWCAIRRYRARTASAVGAAGASARHAPNIQDRNPRRRSATISEQEAWHRFRGRPDMGVRSRVVTTS